MILHASRLDGPRHILSWKHVELEMLPRESGVSEYVSISQHPSSLESWSESLCSQIPLFYFGKENDQNSNR